MGQYLSSLETSEFLAEILQRPVHSFPPRTGKISGSWHLDSTSSLKYIQQRQGSSVSLGPRR